MTSDVPPNPTLGPPPGSQLPDPTHEAIRNIRVSGRVYEAEAAAEVPAADTEPHLPEIHWADVACVGPVLATGLYRMFGSWMFPLLVGSHPLLLIGIRASLSSLIAAGVLVHSGHMALWAALLVPLPYLFFDDPFIYWAGRRYGDRLSSYLVEQDPRWEHRIAVGERLMERWGVLAIIIGNQPYVPVPISVLYFIAGDSRMSIPLFVAADLVGIFLSTATIEALGYALGGNGQAVINTLTHYVWLGVGVSIAITVIAVVLSTRRSLRVQREREAARRDEGGQPKSTSI